MALGLYREGLASLTSSPGGLLQVRGNGTLWTTAVVAGDEFWHGNAKMLIEEVVGDEELLLAADWPGDEFTDEEYFIFQSSPDRRTQETLAQTLLDVVEKYKRLFDTSGNVPLKAVKEYGVTAPPGDAVEGDVFVIGPSGATGAFAGHENDIAITGPNDTYAFLSPERGWHIDSEVDGASTNVVRHWNGTAWSLTGALAAAPDFVGEWNIATAYSEGEVVLYLGTLYVALADSTGEDPANSPSLWGVYASLPGIHGGNFAIHLTFRTSTTATVANTSGNLNAGSALGSSPTMIRANITDIFGANKGAQLAAANAASSSTVKGKLRIVVPGDLTKEFTADVTGVASAGSGARYDFTVTNSTNVGTIADGTEVVLIFTAKGDKGDTGAASTVEGPQGAAGGPFAIPFDFDSETADADPGTGQVRLGSATQNTSVVLRVNDASSGGASIVDLIADIADADNAPLAKGRLYKADDPNGAFLVFNITAITDLSGYSNLTIEMVGSSEADPFADGDDLILDWAPLYKGAQGEQGIQGEQGADFDPDYVVATLDLRDAHDEDPAGTSVLVEDDSAHGNIPILYFLITPGVASPFSAAVWSQGFSFAPGADTSSITHGAGTLEEALDRLFDLAEGVMPDVASAATLDVSGIDAPFARVTGTVGITALTMRAGQAIWLQWAAAGAITHNASTLPLDGGVSRTNVVNSFSKFVSDGSAVTREVFYSGDVVKGPTSGTDNAALRQDGTSGRRAQSSALLIADTTGGLSRSGNGGIPVQGTNTNDNAAAGYVGEEITSTILAGSAVSLTTVTAADVTSISLTAGDWDVSANIAFLFAGGAAPTELRGWIGLASASVPTAPNSGAYNILPFSFSANSAPIVPVGTRRVSVASTTTVYLSVRATFASGSGSAYGHISARRVR